MRKRIKSYVIRSSRMTKSQKIAIEELFPVYGLPYNPSLRLDFKETFNNNNPTIIEIGFGGGEATIELAVNYPNYNFIGIDVHKPGLGKTLKAISGNSLLNVRLIAYDAIDVICDMIKDNSVYGFHLFFPDPWPKKKHHKRRLISKSFMTLLGSKLAVGGYVYIVTDWEDYAEQILKTITGIPQFDNPYSSFAQSQEWRPLTSFEHKGLGKGHTIREVLCKKKQ